MFGFKTLLEKSQEKEIEFLRSEVKELRIQLIAMSGKASEFWNAKLASKTVVKTPDDVVSKIMEKEPKTEEEKKQQQDALKFQKIVFGGH